MTPIQARWESLGGQFTSGPAVASWAADRLDVFGRGTDNALYHTCWAPSSGWQGWSSLGGEITSDPAAVSWSPGRLDVVARGTDGAMYHRCYENGWSGWSSLGGEFSSGPAIASWAPGRLDIVGRGMDNTLYHRCYENGWSDWTSLGGGITSDPAAVSWGQGRLDIVARGADNTLYHKCYENGWSNWTSIGGQFTSGPAMASWGPGRLDVFGRGLDNTLYQKSYENGWSDWVSIGGEGTSDPAAVASGQGRLDVFARGADNSMRHAAYRNGWGDATPAGTGLDATVDECGRMPLVVSGSVNVGPETQTSVDVGGVAYRVVEQKRRLVNDVVEHAFMQDIAAMGVWPGQVIQGKGLLTGDVAPIGPFTRTPGTIRIVTDLIGGTPGPQSARVPVLEGASVDQARRDLIRAINPSDAPGQLKTMYQRASTYREVGVKAGVNVKGAAFGVDANATLDQTYKQTTVVATIRQVFYSVQFTPDAPRAGGFWPAGVRAQDLAAYVGPGNPPLYVDSVQYGRFICVTAQGSFSSSELIAAVKATWEASVSGTVTANLRHKEVLESSEVKIYTIGVPGHGNFEDIVDPLPQLNQVFKNGRAFNSQNLGAPVSFTCRHIADNAEGHVGLVAEYVQPLSVQGADVNDARFQVFDGLGGGLINTQIIANPKDQVTISASGAIDSGVIFSQPHGPEGWIGHKADAAAPLPSAPAFCLVGRFGSARDGWFEVGPYWQGTPSTQNYGGLQVVQNDTNTKNGDNKYKWNVRVDVKRAGAAAAGVFI